MSRENTVPRVPCGLWSAMVRVPIHCWLKVKRDEEKVIEEDYIEITIGGLRTTRTAEKSNVDTEKFNNAKLRSHNGFLILKGQLIWQQIMK